MVGFKSNSTIGGRFIISNYLSKSRNFNFEGINFSLSSNCLIISSLSSILSFLNASFSSSLIIANCRSKFSNYAFKSIDFTLSSISGGLSGLSGSSIGGDCSLSSCYASIKSAMNLGRCIGLESLCYISSLSVFAKVGLSRTNLFEVIDRTRTAFTEFTYIDIFNIFTSFRICVLDEINGIKLNISRRKFGYNNTRETGSAECCNSSLNFINVFTVSCKSFSKSIANLLNLSICISLSSGGSSCLGVSLSLGNLTFELAYSARKSSGSCAFSSRLSGASSSFDFRGNLRTSLGKSRSSGTLGCGLSGRSSLSNLSGDLTASSAKVISGLLSGSLDRTVKSALSGLNGRMNSATGYNSSNIFSNRSNCYVNSNSFISRRSGNTSGLSSFGSTYTSNNASSKSVFNIAHALGKVFNITFKSAYTLAKSALTRLRIKTKSIADSINLILNRLKCCTLFSNGIDNRRNLRTYVFEAVDISCSGACAGPENCT